MKVDQRAWIARRGKCGDDPNCIGKLYRDRLSTLSGGDPVHRFSGVNEVRTSDSLRSTRSEIVTSSTFRPWIRATENGNVNWPEEPSPPATIDDLKIHIGGLIFEARLRDPNTLLVGDTECVSAARRQYCG
jgi:hypothetical protein